MAIERGDYERWSRSVDQLVRRLGGSGAQHGFGTPPIWSPPTDVFEVEGGVVVKMELPGVSPEDLSIVLIDDKLVVKGLRPDADAGRKIHYLQMEIAFGAFAKVVSLRMPYERDGIEATLKDGYLDLFIPRASERTGEKIAVEIRL